MDMEKCAQIFRALGDASRIQILALLNNGESCGNDLLSKLSISQSTLSHHMKILTESELVIARKDGKRTYYSVAPTAAPIAAQALSSALGSTSTPATPAVPAPPEPTPIKKKPKNQFETWL